MTIPELYCPENIYCDPSPRGVLTCEPTATMGGVNEQQKVYEAIEAQYAQKNSVDTFDNIVSLAIKTTVARVA